MTEVGNEVWSGNGVGRRHLLTVVMQTLVFNGNVRRVPERGSQGTGLSLEETAFGVGER